ncbi:hypothetical protein A8B73_07395 [Methylosinus sp. 3S-1]|nr:hypothetical protein A8B73_07395 [Methylosinus sp. 3S-1]
MDGSFLSRMTGAGKLKSRGATGCAARFMTLRIDERRARRIAGVPLFFLYWGRCDNRRAVLFSRRADAREDRAMIEKEFLE